MNQSTDLKRVPESPLEPIKGIAVDSNNQRMWVVGNDWIGCFDGQNWTRVEQKFFDSDAQLYEVSAITGPDGAFYFGTRTGFFSYREEDGIKRIGTGNGLAAGVHELFVDREGLLWVSNAHGVSKIIGCGFSNFDKRHGLLEDEVSAHSSQV